MPIAMNLNDVHSIDQPRSWLQKLRKSLNKPVTTSATKAQDPWAESFLELVSSSPITKYLFAPFNLMWNPPFKTSSVCRFWDYSLQLKNMHKRNVLVFSHALLLARSDSTCHSVMSVVCPSGCPWQDSLPQHDFWAAWAILSNFCFQIFFLFIFSPWVSQKKNTPNFFSPQIFLWVKQGATQCYQTF